MMVGLRKIGVVCRGVFMDGRVTVDSAERTDCVMYNTHKYQVETLWERHREILRLRLLGYKNTEIAAALHIDKQTVSYTVNSNLGRRHLAIMSAARDAEAIDVAKELDKMVPKALKILDEIVDDSNIHDASLVLRAKIATDIVDRKAPKIIREEHLHAHFTAGEIEEIKKRARGEGVVAEEEIPDAEVVDGSECSYSQSQ